MREDRLFGFEERTQLSENIEDFGCLMLPWNLKDLQVFEAFQLKKSMFYDRIRLHNNRTLIKLSLKTNFGNLFLNVLVNNNLFYQFELCIS